MSRSWDEFRGWVKRRETPLAVTLYRIAMWSRNASLPPIPLLHSGLHALHGQVHGALSVILRAAWYTPLFQSRLTKPAPRLFLYGGMPLVIGPLDVTLGADCRVAGQMTISGRTVGGERPRLIVGNNVDLGWGSTISVGNRIEIGNNTRLALGVVLLGYPGHPLDPVARARGEPDTDDQVGEIILEDDVWLGTRVTVLPGVRIGRGTIVGAGSVVSKSLPPMVIAAGVPAVVKKRLDAVARPADDNLGGCVQGRSSEAAT